MFTGIVAKTGIVTNINNGVFRIKTDLILNELKIGDSISIDGACHSLVKLDNNEFEVFSSIETFSKTIVGLYKIDSLINLELPLRANDFIGGHNVSGHVDCIAKISQIIKDDNGIFVQIKIPQEFIKYIISKGSIAINGISLTVNKINEDIIDLYIIPITIEKTNIKFLKTSDMVNIEVDGVAKYIESLIKNFQK